MTNKSKKATFLKPMLASITKKPFDSSEWIYETKWDGFRALAVLNEGDVTLFSRNKKSFNEKFPLLVDELKKLKTHAVIDGEIVALDKNGISHFQLLQNYQDEQPNNIHFMVFDLLFYEGEDLRSLALIERKKRLQKLLQNNKSKLIHYTDHIETKGINFFKQSKKAGLEGIIAKRKNSSYVPMRSNNWLKIKALQNQEFVICGFTQPKNSRKNFGSLLLGLYENGKLQFFGHVGTGFSDKTLDDVYKKLKPLMQKTCPFEQIPQSNNEVLWVRPKLVAQIAFTEMTKENILRQPVFLGLRNDKKASECTHEIDLTMQNFTHLEKVYWPKEGITKGDMLAYYEQIAPFILPHLLGRPVMLRRFPNGIDNPSFYQKNIEKPPSFLNTVVIEHPFSKNKFVRHPIIDSIESLLYIANLGAIEIHPMLARKDSLDYADFVVLDLDPENVSFAQVIKVAQTTHEILNDLNIPNFCKTSGKRGLHIYIPLGFGVLHEDSLLLSKMIAQIIEQEISALVSLKHLPKERQGKVYIDFLQNVKGRSTVAPYSLRAFEKAPVSTPLHWDELTKTLKPSDFTIHTIPKRLDKIGDPFLKLLSMSICIETVLKKVEKKLNNIHSYSV